MMPKTVIPAAAITLAMLMATGCGRPAGRWTPDADSWTTYTSPDARVRFDHSSQLEIRVRSRGDASAPHLALTGSTPDESVQVTLVMRLSDDPLPNYCTRMMDGLADAHTRAITSRQTISLAGGRGFRQEFREAGAPPVELIAVALDAQPVYIHLTCGYTEMGRAELRPVCERIAESLILKK
jgi:hypothetical protein